MNRRKFIKSALAVSSAVISTPAISSLNSQVGNDNNECYIIELKNVWTKTYKKSYILFLEKVHSKGYLSDLETFSSAVRYDFLNERTLSFNGLMLSKTEVAFLLFNKGNI